MKKFKVSYTLSGVRREQLTAEPMAVVLTLLFVALVVGVSFSGLTIQTVEAL